MAMDRAWLDKDGYHIRCQVHGVAAASLVKVRPVRVVQCEEVIGAESYAEPLRCSEQAPLSGEPPDVGADGRMGLGLTRE